MPRATTLAWLYLLGACTAPPPGWSSRTAMDVRSKLGGCAVGDLDPETPGLELAAVGGTGDCHVAWRGADGAWADATVFHAPGEMIQCAIGDADPSRPGAELVVVGMASGGEGSGGPGAAWIVGRRDGEWSAQPIFEDTALIHAVCIRDQAVYVAGFSRKVHRLVRDGDAWRSRALADLPGNGKSLVSRDDGLVVACTDGSLVLLREGAGSWTAEVLHHRDSGRARLGSDGSRVLACDDDGTLMLIDGGRAQTLHEETSKLRGAVLADVDAFQDGIEAATAGYEGRVTVLADDGVGWQATTVYQETGRLHHLACGDVIPEWPGLELVTCGYSGRLVIIGREP